MYLKPTILLCEEEGICKGSGRSVIGLDLHEALCKSSEYLEKYGGHSMAIGLSLKKENFDNFKKTINEYVKSLNLGEIQQIIDVDMILDLKNVDIEDVKELSKLEPYGEANRAPNFVIKNLKIEAIRTLSEGKHLKLSLRNDNLCFDAIGFNLGDYADIYKLGDKVDVLGSLEINSYNGKESIQINLKDIMKSL